MAIAINGSGTITGISAGGLPDNIITNAEMADDSVGIADLSATGTASSSTYLRGDNAWTAIPGIRQIVSKTETGNTTVTSSTWTTFITQDITPTQQDSKFLVWCYASAYTSMSTSNFTYLGSGWGLSRKIGSSNIVGLSVDQADSTGPYGNYLQPAGSTTQMNMENTKMGVDTPNTTSTLTYFGEGRPYKGSEMQVVFGYTDIQMIIVEVDPALWP